MPNSDAIAASTVAVMAIMAPPEADVRRGPDGERRVVLDPPL
jgi:hypothetical protein